MYTYLALGDSYTIGESVPAQDNFPNQLVRLLQQNHQLAFDAPKVIATTGWTTAELTAGIKAQEPLGQYDITTLLIGVNNQYRGLDMQLFAREFTQLLYKAILHTRNGARNVFVVAIPDWSVTPFAKDRDSHQIAREIAAYNKLKRTITQINRCHFIDIAPSTITHGNNPDYLVADALHYNAREYENWASIIAPVVAGQFRSF